MKKFSSDGYEVMLRAGMHLSAGGEISSKWLRDKFGVSFATAKRYMHRIEIAAPVIEVQKDGFRGRVLALESDGWGVK